MRDILGIHFDKISNAISEYLFENIQFIKDITLFGYLDQPELDLIFGNGEMIDRLNALVANKTFQTIPKQDLVILAKILIGFHDNHNHLVDNSLAELVRSKISPKLYEKLELLIRLSEVLYLERNTTPIANLERLMDILPPDIQPSKIIEKYYGLHSNELREQRYLEELLDVIIKYRNDCLDCLMLLGNRFKEKRYYEMAIKTYLKCLSICHSKSIFIDLCQICLSISECYLSLNNSQKAIDYSSIAIDLFRKYNAEEDNALFFCLAYSTRCEGHLLQNNLDLALLDVNSVLEHSKSASIIELRETIISLLNGCE